MATRKFKCKVCGYVHTGDSAPEKCPVCQVSGSEFEEIVEPSQAAPKKKGIDTNSNVYTIVYASVMVIIVAFMLAFVSSSLKPMQDANVENDTKGQILTSLNLDIDGMDVSSVFAEKVQDMIWNGTELVPYEGKFNSTYGSLIKEGELHVFVASTDAGTKYVIPVTGRGLWGGLWGYVALNEDKQTIYGTYFYHESETAGLGSRIAERAFQNLFSNKPLFENGNNSEIALSVVKSGSAQSEYEVNGITGATLTSNGVDAMIKNGLGAYITFISAGNAQNAAACDKACEGKKCEKAEKCADCTKECKDGKKCADCTKECKDGEKCADCTKECKDGEKCADCTKECKDKKAACPKSKECKNKK